MAYVTQDPNVNNQQNTTDVLSNQNQAESQPQTPPATTSQPTSGASTGSSYVSDGNPYGKYGSTQSQAPSRKTTSAPSSGAYTNVQTYVDKNKQSGEQLGQGVAKKLTTTSDIARQNLQNVQNKFQQGVNAGSLEDYGNAVNQAKGAFQEASTAQGPNRTWNANQASMYAPNKNEQGAYSVEDQALIDSNKARVTYGDGSTKEYGTQAEAQNAIDSYNQTNPGYFTYGDVAPLSVSDQRLSDILNASYKGPSELSETSGYNKAYNAYQDVANLQNQALSTGPKTELLNRTFSGPTTQYNLGNKLLDELLLGQGNANKALTDTAKTLGKTATGKVGDEFSDVAKSSRQSALQRGTEMEGIKNQARQALNETANTRTAEVNNRINEVVDNWESYPQYFRDRFQKELDAQGIKVDLNQKFKDVANKYSGGYEGAVSDVASSQKELQDINSRIGDLNAQDAEYIKKIVYSPPLGKFIDLSSGSPQPVDDQRLQKIFDSANKSGIGIPSTGGTTIPYTMESYKNAFSDSSGELLSQQLGQLVGDRDRAQGKLQNASQIIEQAKPYLEYKDFDPNAFNLGLSQLEAEALGVKGGEGLYNLLKDQGIDKLLKTSTADKNKLISQNEQSQLSRLQSIAQLAKDYGQTGSGIDYRNQFTDRDLAGTQNATSALDIDNFRNMLQGSERDFRTDASGANIVGQGYGTGSSGGAFGTKRAQSWKTLEQNLGDLIEANNGYRNIYSDQGVNKDLLKQIAQNAQGGETFNTGYVNPDLVGTAQDVGAIPQDMLQNLLGNKNIATTAATNYALLSNPVTFLPGLANIFGGMVGGSSAEAQGRADYAAQQNALANLQANITNKINTSGLKNQLSVGKNTAQDLELYKLLGMLDTTNL